MRGTVCCKREHIESMRGIAGSLWEQGSSPSWQPARKQGPQTYNYNYRELNSTTKLDELESRLSQCNLTGYLLLGDCPVIFLPVRIPLIVSSKYMLHAEGLASHALQIPYSTFSFFLLKKIFLKQIKTGISSSPLALPVLLTLPKWSFSRTLFTHLLVLSPAPSTFLFLLLPYLLPAELACILRRRKKTCCHS